MSVLLETRGLVKRFGAVTAADSLDVRIAEGEVVALIGGNGAGKTTFLNMVTGYLKPDRGTVHYAGRDITALSERRITQLGICRSFQIPQLFDSLSVRENVLVGLGIVAIGGKGWASAAGVDPARVDEAADEALERYRLAEYGSRRAGVLPEGVRKLLDIAIAMTARPRILLLDEPTSGVSADEKFAIMDTVMQAVGALRPTILFVEHDMDIVRRYTKRILAFYEGRVIADGDPASVLANEEVRRYVIGTAPTQATPAVPTQSATGEDDAARGPGNAAH
ncbi:MAG: ABC transporter ATP-binding protein [Burkholderiaceae bacterium]|jgi:branched-chain amino acid transport system ATP-binding protein|nr:ABC transporter ATP-binding protein [Burkholderiaceae bacterium]